MMIYDPPMRINLVIIIILFAILAFISYYAEKKLDNDISDPQKRFTSLLLKSGLFIFLKCAIMTLYLSIGVIIMRKKLFYDKDDFYLIPFKDYWKAIQNQKEIGRMQMILNALIFINFMREFFDYDYQITNFKSDQAIINLSFQKAKDNKSVMDFFINELVDAYTNLNFDRIDFITVEKGGMITTIHSNGVVETQDRKAEQIIIKNLNKTIKRSAMD